MSTGELAGRIAAVILGAAILALIVSARVAGVRGRKRTRQRQQELGSDGNETPGEYVDKLIDHHLRQQSAAHPVPDPLPRPASDHCRPGRCMGLMCCSYECSQGRCPSIPAEFREPTP